MMVHANRIFKHCLYAAVFWLAVSFINPSCSAAIAADNACIHLSHAWSGRIKASGYRSFPPTDAVHRAVAPGPYDDAALEGRLMWTAYAADSAQLDVHYETLYSAGDLRKVRTELENGDGSGTVNTYFDGAVDDDRRLMDLTAVIHETDRERWYQRIDRLVLALTPPWATVRIGRQALTWGNGMVFNPMDVFNPFSPTDVARDYKIGDDMATATFLTPGGNELQAAAVARKDPVDADVEADHASFAGKYHGRFGRYEIDLMGARHYKDAIVGAGFTGYLGGAAWRTDAIYTFLAEERSDHGFWSLVVNLDYSWMWLNKNWYGLIEYYANSLGSHHAGDALYNPDLTERLTRGEMYTLGTDYGAGTLQTELHPLANLYLNAIVNLRDGSGVLQPRLILDLQRDLQLTLGATRYWGADDTEFGGLTLPYTENRLAPLHSVYCWLAYYF